jgi:hypothetical protein
MFEIAEIMVKIAECRSSVSFDPWVTIRGSPLSLRASLAVIAVVALSLWWALWLAVLHSL